MNRLPREIVRMIFAETDPQTFLQCLLLNRRYYTIAKELIFGQMEKKYSDPNLRDARILPHLRDLNAIRKIIPKFYYHGIPSKHYYSWELFLDYLLTSDIEIYHSVEKIISQEVRDRYYITKLQDRDFNRLSKIKTLPSWIKSDFRVFLSMFKEKKFFWKCFKGDLWTNFYFLAIVFSIICITIVFF